jgi:hypothetical protein
MELYRTEIDRAVTNVPRDQRQEFMKALTERFPAWGFEVSKSRPAPAAQQPVAEAKSPMQLFQDCISNASALSPEQRAEVTRQLQSAGFISAAAPASGEPVKFRADVARKLGVAESAGFNSDRVGRTTADLFEFAEKIDRLLWGFWKQVNPRSNVNKSHTDLRGLVTKALSGETPEAPQQLADALNRTSKLIGGFSVGFTSGLNGLSEDVWQRFNPANIEAEVSGVFGKKEKFWERYCQIFKAYPTWQTFENEVRSRITRDVEQIITVR